MSHRRAIIYFSNVTSLSRIDFDDECFELDSKVSFHKVLIKNSLNNEVYLVYDGFELDTFKSNFWKVIKGSEIEQFVFIYHSKPGKSIRDYLTQLPSCIHSQEARNDLNIPDKVKHYLNIQPYVNQLQEFDCASFDAIWDEYVENSDREIELSKKNDTWFTKISKLPHTNSLQFKNTILVGDVPKRAEKYLNSIGLEVCSVYELNKKLDLDQNGKNDSVVDRIQNDDLRLLVLCEQLHNERNESVKLIESYGIRFVQMLRNKGLKCSTLFLSFQSYSDLIEKKEYAILKVPIGHGFLQIPTSFESIHSRLEQIPLLDDLALHDIKHHFTSFHGIVNEQLHNLRNLIGDSFRNIHQNLLQEICNYYEENFEQVLTTYRQNQADKTEQSSLDFINNYWKSCSSHKSESSWQQSILPKYSWKILWLEDEFKAGKKEVIIDKLEKNYGVKVELATTFMQARGIWEEDRASGSTIKVVITDYRLKNKNDSIQIKQGYHFIEYIAETNADVAIIAYSGLPRKFLIESFKHYGVRLNIYSKIDFPSNDKRSQTYLTNEIILLGDEYWEIANNQPVGSQWDNWRMTYYNYVNSSNFIKSEKRIGEKAQENLKLYIEQYNQNEIPQLTDEFYYSSQAKKFEFDGLIKRLQTRRMILALLTFHQTNRIPTLSSHLSLNIYIANLIHKSSNKNRNKPVVSSGNARQLYTNSFITTGDFPIGLLQEERVWIQSDSGLNYNIDRELTQHWVYISKIKSAFAAVFSESKLLQGLLDEPYFQIRKHLLTGELKQQFDGKEDIYFTDEDYIPFIRTTKQVKQILICLRTHLESKTNSSEYGRYLTDYVQLIRAIYSCLGDRERMSIPLRSLKTFLITIPALSEIPNLHRLQQKRLDYIDEEYTYTYAPWEHNFTRKQRFNAKYHVEIDKFRRLCLQACNDEAFASQYSSNKFSPFYSIYINCSKQKKMTERERNLLIYYHIDQVKNEIAQIQRTRVAQRENNRSEAVSHEGVVTHVSKDLFNKSIAQINSMIGFFDPLEIDMFHITKEDLQIYLPNDKKLDQYEDFIGLAYNSELHSELSLLPNILADNGKFLILGY